MADAIGIKITNLAEIKAAFAMAPGLMSKALDIAIRKTIFTIEHKSMVNTPVATGRLRSSHYTQFSLLKGEVGTNTNYDMFVHEGTRYMQGRPYLRTAVHDSNDEVKQFFTEAVDDVLSKIGRATK